MSIAGADALLATVYPDATADATRRFLLMLFGLVCIVAEIAVIVRDRDQFELQRQEYNDRLLGLHRVISKSDELLELKREAFNLVDWITTITMSCSIMEEQLKSTDIPEVQKQLMDGLGLAETLAMAQFRGGKCLERMEAIIARFGALEIYDLDLGIYMKMGIQETARLRFISNRIKALAERI